MPMHPRLAAYDLFPVLELLFDKGREQALDALTERGFIDATTRPRWQAELQKAQYRKGLGDLVAMVKLMLDPLAAQEGKLSSKSPLEIVSNLLPLMETTRQWGYEHSRQSIADRTVLDFGGGIYYPLSTAIVLFANGYQRAISYEPFELQIDYAVASVFELARAILEKPAAFCFFGTAPRELKARVAALDFEDLPARLESLNRRETTRIDLGGVLLTNRTDTIADASVDLIFSNSVLEHVPDLPAELAWQKRVLTAKGLCFHTVDFADHRYYFDPRLNILEMYYDGILDELNGLRPSQMEALFVAAGLQGQKLQRLAVPESHIDKARARVPPFAGLEGQDLFEWVNGYILRN